MASSNPAMGVLDRAASGEFNFGGLGETATLSGTTTKSIFLVAITFIVGYGSMIYSLGYIIQNQATPSLHPKPADVRLDHRGSRRSHDRDLQATIHPDHRSALCDL